MRGDDIERKASVERTFVNVDASTGARQVRRKFHAVTGGLEAPEDVAQRWERELLELVAHGEIEPQLADQIRQDVFISREAGRMTLHPRFYEIYKDSVASERNASLRRPLFGR
jgi:hypothetical protein